MLDRLETTLISVVIVNYNGLKWLDQCLKSLREQSYKNIQIIMVDNNSIDSSIEFVLSEFPEVEIIRSRENLGFAGGNNLALDYIKGEYVFLLNNDTIVEENAISNLKKVLDNNMKIGSVQAKLVLMNDRDTLDSCGGFWTDTTFLYHLGCYKNKNLDIYNRALKVFANKGAAQMIRKSVIDKVGLFDDAFWLYYEETDFCHRVWISGSECWYEPSAVVFHANGGTSLSFNNDLIQFHNYKNKLMSFIKNFEPITLLRVIPTYLFFSFLISLVFLFQGRYKLFFAIYKSYIWNLTHLKRNLNARKEIKKYRILSDKEIFRHTKKNPKWKYYIYLFTGLEKYND